MELSLQDLKQLIANDAPDDDGGFVMGEKVFIRTVTHYHLGKIVDVTPSFVVLTDASWIADTGRFSEMLANGTINELEPYSDNAHVSRGAIIDHTPWRHSLPRERK